MAGVILAVVLSGGGGDDTSSGTAPTTGALTGTTGPDGHRSGRRPATRRPAARRPPRAAPPRPHRHLRRLLPARAAGEDVPARDRRRLARPAEPAVRAVAGGRVARRGLRRGCDLGDVATGPAPPAGEPRRRPANASRPRPARTTCSWRVVVWHGLGRDTPQTPADRAAFAAWAAALVTALPQVRYADRRQRAEPEHLLEAAVRRPAAATSPPASTPTCSRAATTRSRPRDRPCRCSAARSRRAAATGPAAPVRRTRRPRSSATSAPPTARAAATSR